MIIPTILESSVSALMEKVKKVKSRTDRIQIDIVDGVFADVLTVSPTDVLDVDFGKLAVDLHLMTEEPVNFLDECADLHTRVTRLRVIGQIERMSNQGNFIDEAHNLNCSAGLALALYTPLSSVRPKVLLDIDCLLLLGVKTGFSGEHFNHSIIDKIKDLRNKWPHGDIIIDGGEDPTHIQMCKKAGASSFAVNSFLWQHDNITVALKQLQEAAHG